MSARYTVETTADVALSAAAAKTILSWVCAANAPARLIEFYVGFDGVTAGAEPVSVELCLSTEATAGTSTAQTPVQIGGSTRTVQGSGKRNFTAEPTVLTVVKRWLVHPQAGLLIQFPLGREPEQNTSADAFCLRCIAPAAVNAQAYLEVEEG